MSDDRGPTGSGADGADGGDADTAPDGSDAAAVDRAAAATDYDVSEWLSLEPDEEVVWVGEPTTLRLVGTVVTGILLIPFLVGVIVLLAAPFSYLGIKHTDYVVTNRSLYVKQGILSTNIESVDLDRIQNTEFTQTFWGKQLGFGTIEVSTAGSAGADISFSDIEDAREVREQVSTVQREFGGGRGGRDGTGGGERAAHARQAASADKLDELVAELRATREALERVEERLAERPRDAAGSDDAGGEIDSDDGSNRTDVDWPDEN